MPWLPMGPPWHRAGVQGMHRLQNPVGSHRQVPCQPTLPFQWLLPLHPSQQGHSNSPIPWEGSSCCFLSSAWCTLWSLVHLGYRDSLWEWRSLACPRVIAAKDSVRWHHYVFIVPVCFASATWIAARGDSTCSDCLCVSCVAVVSCLPLMLWTSCALRAAHSLLTPFKSGGVRHLCILFIRCTIVILIPEA